MTQTVAIAGGGHAAGQVVATLKQNKFVGRIVLVGEEPYLPYQRPPLSKKFLAGELPAERLFVKPPSFYGDDNIDVCLDTRVESIDRRSNRLQTSAGKNIEYDKLVLALGSRVRRVPVAGEQLDGVNYLRSIADVDRIRPYMRPGKRVVIVGAGYIGLEVAAVCCERGVEVTVIEMADRVMSRVVSPEVSEFYQQQHTGHGVRLLLSTGLSGFHGDGHVDSVETDDGQILSTDFVIVGVGIEPNTEPAAAAGLEVDNGIVVDDQCRTLDPDIYAVGDCTRHPNGIYGRHVRLESVHNAVEQAKTAASNICGADLHYSDVPWFWSDQYDLKLQIAGLSDGYDTVVVRGDPATKSFSCAYLKDAELIAVDAINAPRDFMQSKALIAAHAKIDPQKLADIAVALKDLG